MRKLVDWQNLIPNLDKKVYLEIGTLPDRKPGMLNAKYEIIVDDEPNTKLFGISHCMTSEVFFEMWPRLQQPNPDVILINKVSSFARLVCDYAACCRILNPGGMIFVSMLVPLPIRVALWSGKAAWGVNMSRWTNAVPGIENKVYLELGVHEGRTFSAVAAREKYGVDHAWTDVTHPITTDAFFAQWDSLGLPRPDVVFIDADHNFAAVARDYRNTCRILAPGGIVFAHDLIPPDHFHTSAGHCNDAYKLLYWALRDDLRWAPGCFSNCHDYGCTCFPTPLPPPEEIPAEVYLAKWEDLLELLRPEHKLTDEEFAIRVSGNPRIADAVKPILGAAGPFGAGHL